MLQTGETKVESSERSERSSTFSLSRVASTIAAEAIASTDGLGYRIFLVRRYLAMDVILPYVIWITLLAFFIDYGLRKISQWCFPWFHAASGGKA